MKQETFIGLVFALGRGTRPKGRNVFLFEPKIIADETR